MSSHWELVVDDQLWKQQTEELRLSKNAHHTVSLLAGKCLELRIRCFKSIKSNCVIQDGTRTLARRISCLRHFRSRAFQSARDRSNSFLLARNSFSPRRPKHILRAVIQFFFVPIFLASAAAQAHRESPMTSSGGCAALSHDHKHAMSLAKRVPGNTANLFPVLWAACFDDGVG
jgi:hypothetical protein